MESELKMNEDLLNSICRSCLVETKPNALRPIFKVGKICNEIARLCDMLSNCTNLEYDEEDGLPGHICNKCVSFLSKAYAFKKQCVQSDESLRERFKIPHKQDEQVFEAEQEYQDYSYVQEEIGTGEEDGDQKAIDGEEKIQTEEEVYEETTEYITNDNPDDENYQIIKLETSNRDSPIKNTEYEIYEEEEGVIDESMEIVSEEVADCERNDIELEGNDAHSGEDADNMQITKLVLRKNRRRAKKVPGPPFKCEECSKELSNYSSYKYHIQLHSDHTPYLCSECGEGFKTRNAYDGHMITHAVDNPHTCKECGKSYRQAASLRCHMLSHTGVKPFLCGICGKGMTQKSGYKKHMLTHSGEKPHTCDFCGKQFRYSSNLIMHKRSHTGDKPYSCDICEKRFIGVEQLKRHKVIHSGERPFSCEFCARSFNRKSTLQVHRQIHTSDRKHVCSVCGKAYIQLSCLKMHMAVHKDSLVYEDVEIYEEVQLKKN